MVDLFDESLRHLIAEGRAVDWAAGPVAAVPSDRRDPGTLGWSATLVRLTPGPAPASEPVGDVYLFVLPQPGTTEGRPGAPPLLGARWEEFASVDYHPGTPRLILLARAANLGVREPLRAWTQALFQHLTDELD